MSIYQRILNEANHHSLETDHGCGYVDGMCRAAEIAKGADEIYEAGSGLIESVMARYDLKSTDELTCPHMRALAKTLSKARGES